MVLDRDPQQQGALKPTLGLFTAITLVVGSMIGSGIFRLPANMLVLVQNPLALVLVWVVGGIITICGALTVAELAGMFPQAGGQYQFLKKSLGKKWAFLWGWTYFWVVQAGILAGVALVFAEFTRRMFGFDGIWDPAVAVLCIASLTIVNYFGSKFGGAIQNLFTVAKTGALVILIVTGFAFGNPSHDTFSQTIAGAPTGFALFSAFFGAMVLALFALDGWPYAASVAPEIKNPKTNVPRAMLLGVLIVTTVYVLATAVYLFLVPAGDIISIGTGGPGGPVSAAAAQTFAGETGAKLISAAVMASTFGTVNGFILMGPRIFYAVAQDGMFPKRMAALHPNFNTPGFSLILQGFWAGLLICLARFAADAYTALVSAVVFGIWLFYLPTVIGYFRLRIYKPDLPRPYRTTFYPVTPALFLLAGFLVIGNMFYTTIRDALTLPYTSTNLAGMTALWGSVFVLLGVPFVLKWRAAEKRGEPSPAQGGSVFDEETPPPAIPEPSEGTAPSTPSRPLPRAKARAGAR